MTESVRPSIPRPNLRASVAPPSQAPQASLARTSSHPPREKLATLDLEDADIVGIAVAPRSSFPPPSPGIRRTTAPPPPPSVRASVPPPPASYVAVRRQATPTGGLASVPIAAAPSVIPAPPSIPPPPSTLPAPPSAAPVVAPVTVAPARPSPSPAPAPVRASAVRLSINDPTDLIFDGMYGLSFARSTTEAAEVCAETLARALGARAVVIHRHDLLSRELRAIGAHGDGDFDILGSAEASDDDIVASAVICNQKSVTMRFDGELSRLAPKRLHHVGSPRTLVAAPAMSWGRCIAIIEVIDADERFEGRVADSVTYVAEHFAQFLSTHAA
jgi:hypothetical protein